MTSLPIPPTDPAGGVAYEVGCRCTALLEPDGRVRAILEHHDGSATGFSELVGLVATEARLAVVRESRTVSRFHDQVRRSDGDEPMGAEVALTPILTVDGEVDAILLQLTDGGAARAIELELRESERRFRELTEALPQKVWLLVPGQGVQYVSPRWREFTGRPVDELLGAGFLDRVHPDDVEQLTALNAVTVADRGVPVTFRFLRHDGEYRWMEARLKAVRDADGQVRYVLGGTADITERRREEDEARETAEQLQVALDVTGLGRYVHYLREGRVIGDERAQEINGYDVVEVIEREGLDGFIARIDPADRQLFTDRLGAALNGGGETTIEYRVRQPDGEVRLVSTSARIEFDEDGPCRVIGVVEDITGRRAAEQHRAAIQKREALGTLVGGLAHDFNNLLSAILSSVALAEGEVKGGAAPDESLGDIRRGAERAASLVRRMLDYAREDPVGSELVDLASVIADATDLTRPGLPASIALKVESGSAPGKLVRGDENQLHQVLFNLLTNARQAIGDAPGTITVTLRPCAGDRVELRVSDDGPGMPPEVARRIFDPFFTTKPTGQGTGLGLASVATIVARHGGDVDVETTPGVGTTFVLTLPGATEATSSDVAGDTAATGALPPTTRVLYVDDEPALTRLAKRALPEHGCVVDAFEDPAEAVAAFEARPDQFDVVITDQAMPAMTGLELIEQVRAARPSVATVLISGFLPDEQRAAAAELGVDAVLGKPCPVDEIAAEIKRVARPA